MNNVTANVLAKFRRHGMRSSFHYADDSTREWASGDWEKNEALAIFDAHPDLEVEMREIAKKFLWSLNLERPVESA